MQALMRRWPVSLRQQWWQHGFSLGFGLGLLPGMPGTWGTLAALPFYAVLMQGTLWQFGLGWLLLFAFSIWTSGQTAQALGDKDPKCVVCDEVVGWLLVLMWVPQTPQAICMSFVLFRFFDVLKPWPIGWVDRCCRGGFGIVMDDVLAGCYVLLCYAFYLYGLTGVFVSVERLWLAF